MQPILNPEPNRFVCTGPLARYNADNLAEFSRDRGMTVVVLDAANVRFPFTNPEHGRRGIADAEIIIDVIR